MLKARKIENGIRLYNPQRNINYNFTNTTWEIIKAVKKHGKEQAVKKIIKLFNIDEKNAKEDINTVLTNLKTLKIKIEDIPLTVSKVLMPLLVRNALNCSMLNSL